MHIVTQLLLCVSMYMYNIIHSWFVAYRNPDKSARPQFREIVQTLSQSEDELLFVPEGVTRAHPQASVLGAPLEAGRDLYTQLQNTYMPI